MKTFLFLIGFLPILLFSSQTTSVVDSKGYGVSRGEAIQNALIEVLKQTKGVAINSQKSFSKKIKQANYSNNGKNSKSVGVNSLSASQVREATKGLINEYRILKERRISNTEWEVKLRVKILNYKSPGLSNKHRRKIAVMEFQTLEPTFIVGSKRYKASKVRDMLAQALTTNITQARRFAVVDRSYTSDMQNEMNLIGSREVPLREKVKLGQKLGADYLLVGTIQNASFYNKTQHNQSLGTTSNQQKIEFIIDYRIIVVGTSQIKWSDTVKATIDTSKESGSYAMAMQNALEKVSARITNALLENIYPIRIVQITKTGNIVLNQGGNSLKKGMKMNVMQLGAKMIDPYTKESLGRTETNIAQIEITRVTAKLSYAKLVKGALSLLKKNDICRREKSQNNYSSQEEVNNPSWRKTTVKVQQGGGVILPF